MSFNYEAASTIAAMLKFRFDDEHLARQVGEQFANSIIDDEFPEARNLFFSGLISFWFEKKEITVACLKLLSRMSEKQTKIGSIDFRQEAKELLKLLKGKNSLNFTKKSIKLCKIIFLEMKNMPSKTNRMHKNT